MTDSYTIATGEQLFDILPLNPTYSTIVRLSRKERQIQFPYTIGVAVTRLIVIIGHIDHILGHMSEDFVSIKYLSKEFNAVFGARTVAAGFKNRQALNGIGRSVLKKTKQTLVAGQELEFVAISNVGPVRTRDPCKHLWDRLDCSTFDFAHG
jgi:hypothetical protein